MKTPNKNNDLLEKLFIDRSKSAETFKKPSMAGFSRVLEDMYADKAHFIYELVQNADDAISKNIKFILNKDELIFIHDGKTKFTISDPESEKIDSINDRLGHINSICSVGNTTKSKQKIGKFGIGFKSIFKYSKTPVIIDDNFCFKIEDLFVPTPLEASTVEQYSLHRNHGETLFYIPFNKDYEEGVDAFNDIFNKFEEFPEQILFFLNNIKSFTFSYDDNVKKVKINKTTKTLLSNSVKDKNIKSCISQLNKNKYLLISTDIKELKSQTLHKISIVYPLNIKNEIHPDSKYNAYCFFPTSEPTELKFMVHAPFLLTDNRQNIKVGIEWNNYLIKKLSELISESLFILKDNGFLTEDFFSILPLKRSEFKIGYYSERLFFPIFSKIVDTLKSNKLLPSNTEAYTSGDKAYLVRSRELIKLLPPNILSEFVNEKNVKIVFPSITEATNSDLINYCKNELGIESIRPDDFVKKLTIKFIAKMSDNWLIMFYKFCNNIKYIWKDLKNKPILKLSDDTISAPFKENKPIVFLEEIDGNFPSIKDIFLNNKESYDFFINLGLGKPDMKDLIFRIIFSRYKIEHVEVEDDVLINDIRIIITYYKEANRNDSEELIRHLSQVSFLVGYDNSSKEQHFYNPNELYILNDDLKQYFTNYPNYRHFDTEYYKSISDEFGYEDIKIFLLDCGVSEIPRIISETKEEDHPEFTQRSTARQYDEYNLDGFDSFISDMNLEKSELLWSFLTKVKDIERYIHIEFRYRYRNWYTINDYKSEFYNKITGSKWIYDVNENLSAPKDITLSSLNKAYDINSSGACRLINLLGFKEDRLSTLTSEEQEELELGRKMKAAGISATDIAMFIDEKRKTLTTEQNVPTRNPMNQPILKEKISIEDSFERQKKRKEMEIQSHDEYLPPKSVLPEEIRQKIKEELEDKEAEIMKLQELELTVQESETYTFKWFKALLDLEYFTINENELRRSQIRIKFYKIEKDIKSDNILILQTNEYIPIKIEDNGELQLTINYEELDSKNILIDAVSRQNKTLKAKINDNIDLDKLNLDNMHNAVIEIRNANFIFDSLKSTFFDLENFPYMLTDDYNFQNNLPKDLQFIYGPPGTGKTTRLAQKIFNLTAVNKEFKVLVLCPTNKAADVLTAKLLEQFENIPDFLIRFGITNDANIEKSVYSASKYIKPLHLHKVILITTVARFPYDVFKINTKDKKLAFPLKEFDWSHLIFDEASMINLPSIILPIYYRLIKKNDTSFIIAGDPFQIGPIIQTDVEGWKDGNIYSLVNLNHKDSFLNPQTFPHKFDIENLTTQYRSNPVIGKLFSNFTYGGILSHHRSLEDIANIEVNGLELKPLTWINFKVNPFESIYKPHRLKGSPYQVYSAIFAVEFILYMIENISFTKSDLTIGIICPYRAQKIIIDKILASFSKPTKFRVYTGTIHSFQGDECDIIISVFNPPKSLKNYGKVFLNKQNILNVAISRAKDYLIILSPHDPQQKIETDNLHKIKDILRIIKNNEDLVKYFIEYNSSEIEKLMLGSHNAIVDSCFSTSHQEVNIYSKLDKKYEIRYDDNAVDIQIKFT